MSLFTNPEKMRAMLSSIISSIISSMTWLVVYKEYSGQDFNKILGAKKLYRFTYHDEIHNGFQYKDGLNIDHLEFYPYGTCGSGGLYFVDENNIWNYLINSDFQWIREVTIPFDARVYVDKGKYKSDKFILEPRKRISEYEIETHRYAEAVKQIGYMALQFVKDQTNEICMEAVKQNGRALEFVKEQTNEIYMEAVKQNGRALEFVKEQTNEICMEAVKQNGCALEFVKDQTHEICMEAVKKTMVTHYNMSKNKPMKYVWKQLKNMVMHYNMSKNKPMKYVWKQLNKMVLHYNMSKNKPMKYVWKQLNKMLLH